MKVIGKNWGGTLTEKEMEFITTYRLLSPAARRVVDVCLEGVRRCEVCERITGEKGNITTVDFSKRQTQEGE